MSMSTNGPTTAPQQPQGDGNPAKAASSPADGLPLPHDAAFAGDGQSAISAYDRMLQDKERVILESIARKRSKIHEVERQLAELQLALHVNVGPRRQALEHLRSLIEQQNHRIDTARSAFKKAKQEMEHWQRAMEEAQQRKEQLAAELTTLVQQSAGAQLRKLEQLSEELDHLTADMPPAAAANGAHTAAHGGSSQGAAPAADPAVQPQRAGDQQQPQQQQQAQQAPAGHDPAAPPAPRGPAEEELAAQRRRVELERQRQAAAAARGRHVQLGRQLSGGAAPARAPAPPAPHGGGQARSGPFQGFD